MRAYNLAARTSLHSGYALAVSGKFKVTDDNAQRYSFSGTASSWNVFPQFCGAGDKVFITPVMDITAGGAVPNSLWVSQVSDSYFQVKSANPVSNLAFDYFIVSK